MMKSSFMSIHIGNNNEVCEIIFTQFTPLSSSRSRFISVCIMNKGSILYLDYQMK